VNGRRHPLWLVATREITEALRRKSFWITIGVLVAISSAAMILPEVLASDDDPIFEVAVFEATAGFEQTLVDTVAEGEVDLAVVGADPPIIVVTSGANAGLVGVVRQALATTVVVERLVDAGLDDDEIAGVLEAVPAPRLALLDPSGDARRLAAFVLSLAMYLILILVMTQVANGVAVEKSNRISEVLLPIVSPTSLLFGKVLGLGLLGVATVVAGAAPVIVKLGLGGDLPDGLGGALAGGGAWFLLGLALYLIIAGALAALVERTEEASSVLMPLNIVLIGAYLVGGSAPDSALSRVLAYLPLTSPMVMPSRLAVGAASPVEMAISLGLGVAAVLVAIRFGAIVYRRAIVRTGRRLKLRQLLRAA
jgi:ABC-2 type transport system permease protein